MALRFGATRCFSDATRTSGTLGSPVRAEPLEPSTSMAPIVELVKSFRFEAAHRLPNVPDGHKCARVHGHSYCVDVVVRGPVGEQSGWLIDYGDIAKAWRPLHAVLDHYYLNDVEGLSNPTSEVLAVWVWERLVLELPGLARVTVHETCTSSCSYFGE